MLHNLHACRSVGQLQSLYLKEGVFSNDDDGTLVLAQLAQVQTAVGKLLAQGGFVVLLLLCILAPSDPPYIFVATGWSHPCVLHSLSCCAMSHIYLPNVAVMCCSELPMGSALPL